MTTASALFHARSAWPLPLLQRGFTLTELMVTVAVAAILAALAAPAMTQILADRAVDGQAQELATSLRLARSEAIKRGLEVSVCASLNTTATSPTCSGDTQWAKGWLVFYDYNANGLLDGDDKALRIQAGGNKGLRDVVSATVALTFARNGILLTPAAAVACFQLQPNVSAGSAYNNALRAVRVNKQGRVESAKGAGATCP
jgi:type IV fimbrial biogenesis protein FimT